MPVVKKIDCPMGLWGQDTKNSIEILLTTSHKRPCMSLRSIVEVWYPSLTFYDITPMQLEEMADQLHKLADKLQAGQLAGTIKLPESI